MSQTIPVSKSEIIQNSKLSIEFSIDLSIQLIYKNWQFNKKKIQ